MPAAPKVRKTPIKRTLMALCSLLYLVDTKTDIRE